MFTHTLVVGGTGMLRGASAALAARSKRLTSVARTERSLRALAQLLPPGSGRHHALPLDWSDPGAFLDAIVSHVDATEPPDLVVAWIHGLELALDLARRLARPPHVTRFFHVIGSAARAPDRIAHDAAERFEPPEGLLYRQIVLGARGRGPTARWLTDEEVSAGVLDAVDLDRPLAALGSFERWRGLGTS